MAAVPPPQAEGAEAARMRQYVSDVKRNKARQEAKVVDLREVRKAHREDASVGELGPIFKDIKKALTNDEVAHLLDVIARDADKGAAQGGSGKEVFNKCRAYARRFERFKSVANLDAVRTLLDQYNFSPFEMAAFCNLAPESAEEAIAVVPTLKRLPEATLTTIIEEVQPHRKYGD